MTHPNQQKQDKARDELDKLWPYGNPLPNDVVLTRLLPKPLVFQMPYEGFKAWILANYLSKAEVEAAIRSSKQKGSWCCHPDEGGFHHVAPIDVQKGFSQCNKHQTAGGSTADASYNQALRDLATKLGLKPERIGDE